MKPITHRGGEGSSLAVPTRRGMDTGRNQWLRLLLLLTVLVLGYWHGTVLRKSLSGNDAVLELDAKVSTGTRLQIYVNSLWSEPHATNVSTNQWTTYRFAAPSRLTVLRIDPPPASGTVMMLKEIRLRGSDRTTARLPLTTLNSWPKVGVDFSPAGPDGIVRMETTQAGSQSGAYIMGSLALDVTRPSIPFLSWYRINPAGFIWALLLFAGILLCAVSNWRSWPRVMALAGILFAGGCATHYVARYLQSTLKTPPAVSSAVGYSGFNAYPKSSEIEALIMGLLAAFIFACATGFLIFRRAPANLPFMARFTWRTRDLLLLGSCFLLFAGASLPPSAAEYQSALHAKHSPDIDSQNGLYWEYAADRGELPFRDFWYPYSGMYNESIPLYPYIARQWVAKLLVFGVTAISIYACLGGSWPACLGLWGILILMDAANLFWSAGVWRYLLAASIALLAVAAMERRSRWMAAALGLWTVYAVSEEISQPVYALPAVLLLFCALFWADRANRFAYRRVLIAAGAVGAVAALSYLALLAYRGQIGGWLAFIAELPSTGIYAAWPLDFGSWLGFPETVQQLYLTLVIVLLITGALQAAASRLTSPALLAPLCLGVVSAMQIQKEVIRPGISLQLLVVPALGLALLVAQQLLLAARPWRAAVAGSYAGVILLTVFFLSDPTARAELRQELNFAPRLHDDLAYTVGHSSEWQKAGTSFFSPAALGYGTMSGQDMRTALDQAMNGVAHHSLYVLGDRADIYVLLRKPAPYYITFYNESPIDAQKRTLQWLNDKHPDYVLWNPEDNQFDGVPNVVRVPLLFRYVVSHYVPVRKLGPFQLFRSRRKDEAPDVAYWRTALGDTVPLGYIPSLSVAESTARDGGPALDRYLLVGVENPVTGRAHTVSMTFGGQPVSIQFFERATVSKYAVNLERLPWSDLEHGLPLIKQQEPGLQIRVVTLAFDKEPLY